MLSKQKNAFVKSLPQFYAISASSSSQRAVKIHCHLRQIGTETGRLSAENPNLQQMPHAIEFDLEDSNGVTQHKKYCVRNGFVSRDGIFCTKKYFALQ